VNVKTEPWLMVRTHGDIPTAISVREADLAAEGAENADHFFMAYARDDRYDWTLDLISAAMRHAFIRTDDTHVALLEAANRARDDYARHFESYAGNYYLLIALERSCDETRPVE
jgi:hypothetical protein